MFNQVHYNGNEVPVDELVQYYEEVSPQLAQYDSRSTSGNVNAKARHVTHEIQRPNYSTIHKQFD